MCPCVSSRHICWTSISKATGTFPEERQCQRETAHLSLHVDELNLWVLPRLEVSMGTRMLLLLPCGPGDTLSMACRDTTGFQARPGAPPALSTAVLTPSRHWASSAGPQDRVVGHACKARTGIGKGQRHLEVLEKRLIIPVSPEEREIREDDLSLVDCLRRLRGSSDTSTPFLS